MPVEVLRLKVSKECFERIDSGTIKEILFDPYDKENVPKLLDVVSFSQAYDFSVQTFRKGFIEKFLRKYDYAIISCDGNDDEIRLNDPKIVIHGNDNEFCYAVEFSDKVLVAQEFYPHSIIRCATCSNEMDVYRDKFPICDDCLKDLREIIKERKSNGKKETVTLYDANDKQTWPKEDIVGKYVLVKAKRGYGLYRYDISMTKAFNKPLEYVLAWMPIPPVLSEFEND